MVVLEVGLGVHSSQQNLDKNPKTDFEDYHYPKVDQIKALATNRNRAKAPVILTEYSPSGPGGVAYAWDIIWPNEGMAGAFLYQWQDQGIADKFPERWSYHSPDARPADFVPGSAPPISGTPAANMTNGMRLDGRPRCHFHRSPADQAAVRKPQAGLQPSEHHGPRGCPGGRPVRSPLAEPLQLYRSGRLTCRWQALAGKKVLAGGESHVAVKPRSSADASFPATPGMDTLRLEFIHPDGRSVYVATLKVKGPETALGAAVEETLKEMEMHPVKGIVWPTSE